MSERRHQLEGMLDTGLFTNGTRIWVQPEPPATFWCHQCKDWTYVWEGEGQDEFTCDACGELYLCDECGTPIDREGNCPKEEDRL